MPIPAGSVMQFTWKGLCFGQVIRHVRCWRLKEGGVGPASLVQHAQQFLNQMKIGGANDFTTPYRNCLSFDWGLRQYRAQIISPTRSAYAYDDLALGAVDGVRAIGVTGNLQAAIEASTDLAGRSQVGVYKIGPISHDDCQNGLLKPALTNLLLPYAATFTLPITLPGDTSSVWVPCIYHYRKPALPVPFDDIYEASPFPEVRVKNTRTLRRGE